MAAPGVGPLPAAPVARREAAAPAASRSDRAAGVDADAVAAAAASAAQAPLAPLPGGAHSSRAAAGDVSRPSGIAEAAQAGGSAGRARAGAPDAAEFEARRGEARQFLASLYRDFAGVEGDERAIALWADLIAAGTVTREQAVEHFLDAAPTLQGAAPLARLYFAYFQRVPDESGWSHWRSVVAGGEDLRAVSERFASSPEFAATYGAVDDAGFVDLVFRNTLGRPATPAEVALWQGQLATGLATRGQVMLAFAETPDFRETVSPEVNAALLYSGLLRRSADAPGLAAWMQTVDGRGLTRAEMIAGFLASAEYRDRAGTGP